ncbi:MAG TPA: arsenate reductase ArsC [Pyrinomonadaceae bacterium]|jgi:arsenate reductase|nr:arsenate reductase ArsC [Pyrinomonadaceae bacterium]
MSEPHKQRVLILCTGNSARSQMGEGLLRHLAGDRFEVFSAGTFGTFVRPQAIAVMGEIGIDISQHRSKSLDEFLDTPFDYVITVCDHANQRCPVFPGPATRLHWSVDDPVIEGSPGAQLDAFRHARDDLYGRIRQFLKHK